MKQKILVLLCFAFFIQASQMAIGGEWIGDNLNHTKRKFPQIIERVSGYRSRVSRGKSLRVSEQLGAAYGGAIIGVAAGFLVTGGIFSLRRGGLGKGLERGGWAVRAMMIGGTIGAPLGSATMLKLRLRKEASYGWILIGAALPAITMTTVELSVGYFSKGGWIERPPYISILGWLVAPVGAVIAYNLTSQKNPFSSGALLTIKDSRVQVGFPTIEVKRLLNNQTISESYLKLVEIRF